MTTPRTMLETQKDQIICGHGCGCDHDPFNLCRKEHPELYREAGSSSKVAAHDATAHQAPLSASSPSVKAERTMLEAVRERAEFCDHINQRILPQSAAVKDRAYLLLLVDAFQAYWSAHQGEAWTVNILRSKMLVANVNALLERKEC